MPPNNACQTCKTRRIKCDEGLPICQRCTKSRRTCTHARPSSIKIISENRYAAGKVHRPRGPRTAASVMPNPGPHALRLIALECYLRDHLGRPQKVEVDISGSLSVCVVEWLNSGRHSPMVDLALASMSLAVYARKQSSTQAGAEAFATYHELLKLLQDKVSRPLVDSDSIDTCLLTAFLMGRCESAMHYAGNLDHSLEFANIKSWSHHAGVEALLRLWHAKLSHEGASITVKQTRRGMLKSLLLRALPVPKWLQDGKVFGEEGLELDFDRIFARLVNLRCLIRMQEESPDSQVHNDMLAEAQDVSRRLEIFKSSLPTSYQRTAFEAPWQVSEDLQCSIVFICFTHIHSAIWAHILATSLLVSYLTSKILRSSDTTQLEADKYDLETQQCVQSLIALIPHCLSSVTLTEDEIQWIDQPNINPYQASLIIWPLTIATSLKWHNDDQRRSIKSVLAGLGRKVGDGVVEATDTRIGISF